jgi:hypothetical protein
MPSVPARRQRGLPALNRWRRRATAIEGFAAGLHPAGLRRHVRIGASDPPRLQGDA